MCRWYHKSFTVASGMMDVRIGNEEMVNNYIMQSGGLQSVLVTILTYIVLLLNVGQFSLDSI